MQQILDSAQVFVYTITMKKAKKYPICPECKIETDPHGLFYVMPYQYIKYICKKCGSRVDKKIGKLVHPY